MTGNPGMGGVHSHLGVQPSKGLGDSGKFDPGTESTGQNQGGMMNDATQRAGEVIDQARDQVSGAAEQARERVGDLTDQARSRLDDVRGQAGDVLEQARSRVSGLMDQAQGSEPVRMARENPLPALGIAFALGFLLAGSSDTGGKFGKAKHQIRGAVMGGISAALAQEMRRVMGGQGSDLLDGLLGNRSGGTGSQA